jgi:hypothetical protein
MRREGKVQMLRRESRQFLLVAAFLLVFGPVLAGEIKGLGAFKRWDAYYYTENNAKVCYIASRPVKEEGDYVRRGEVFILVTHRPAAKTQDVVSLQAGYFFKEGAGVMITIDKVTGFTLFTEGDLAWAEDTKTDQALIDAMKKGSRMVVVGTSKRGTKTTDTYSLAGFTASHRAINLACGLD